MEPRRYSHLNEDDMTNRPEKGTGRIHDRKVNRQKEEDGQLVALGYAVASCTPAPYQRHRL